MILNYFGTRVYVDTKNNIAFENMIGKKYCPVIKTDDDNLGKEKAKFSITINISEEILFAMEDLFRRIIIHGGSKKEYYLTGLEKMEGCTRKVYVDSCKVYILSNMKNNEVVLQGCDVAHLFKIFDLVIVEIFYRSREIENNAFHFHASAIADINHKGTIFIGNKNAGKTTFLCESVFRRKFNYVCNDNCFVEYEKDGKFKLVPWFEDIKIKLRTMENYNINMECTRGCEISPDKEKVFLPLSKGVSNLGLNYVGVAQLKRIIILNYCVGESKIERGWNSTRFQEIYDNVKIPHDLEHYEFLGLFNEFNNDRFDQLNALIDNISKSIEVLKISYSITSMESIFNQLFDSIQ